MKDFVGEGMKYTLQKKVSLPRRMIRPVPVARRPIIDRCADDQGKGEKRKE